MKMSHNIMSNHAWDSKAEPMKLRRDVCESLDEMI